MFSWVFNPFYFPYDGRESHVTDGEPETVVSISHVTDGEPETVVSISHVTFPKVTSVWGVSAVAILDSSVNCVCVWSAKKLTMPAYCVAANCNNSQTTPGITMHELPRNRPAVRRKWINLFNSNELTFLLRRITPICVASTSVSAISQTPWNTAWGLLRS